MVPLNTLFVAGLALQLSHFAHGQLFTLSCNPLTIQRSDPVVAPGKLSGHVHSIVGGNNFQQTMTEATALAGTATTCNRYIDLSNYWVPQLYHHNSNGTFSLIEFQGFVSFDSGCKEIFTLS